MIILHGHLGFLVAVVVVGAFGAFSLFVVVGRLNCYVLKDNYLDSNLRIAITVSSTNLLSWRYKLA